MDATRQHEQSLKFLRQFFIKFLASFSIKRTILDYTLNTIILLAS